MSQRPVYVPKRKRSERFHGAFTGGFSAGYFNTVGSREGWQPANEVRTGQRPEDFMDEADHDEWGGPSTLRQEFGAEKATVQQQSAIGELFQVSAPVNVGQRLLRQLGWRESGTYVDAEPGDSSKDLILSKRRLRKIERQQQQAKIPPPKLDTAGLGFEAMAGAPEFQAERERRRRLAMERARSRSNVYRVTDAMGCDDEDAARKPAAPVEDHYVSYETVEDFVGSRTTSGFALHEDEDDTYDDTENMKREAYSTTVFEPESDDDNDDPDQTSQAPDLTGALTSWAQPTAATGGISTSVTSDGRPVLPGFVLGSHDSAIQRFPGPDLPPNYSVERHVFGEHEHPMVLKALSHAEKLQQADTRRQQAMDDALNKARVDRAPVRPGVFAGLATGMKDRFTSSSTTVESHGSAHPVGLSIPSKQSASSQVYEDQPQEAKPEVSQPVRTITSFIPDRLLCKRFNVPVPKLSTIETKQQHVRTKEEVYFEDEILHRAKAAQEQLAKEAPATNEVQMDKLAVDKEVSGGLDSQRPSIEVYKSIFEPELDSQRPSIEVYKSIFEPDSESSASESDEEDTANITVRPIAESSKAPVQDNATIGHSASPAVRVEGEQVTARVARKRSASVDSSKEPSDDSRRQRKRLKKEERKDKKKRKHRRDKKRKKKSSRQKES